MSRELSETDESTVGDLSRLIKGASEKKKQQKEHDV